MPQLKNSPIPFIKDFYHRQKQMFRSSGNSLSGLFLLRYRSTKTPTKSVSESTHTSHSSICRYYPFICSKALFAAFCSASFLLRPLPLPKTRPSCVTSAIKNLLWSGPCSSTILYCKAILLTF